MFMQLFRIAFKMTFFPSPPPLSHKGRGEKTLSPWWERVAEGRVRGKTVVEYVSL
jgi:hypothetical protein